MQAINLTQPVWAIGLMSGTSLDGIDVALLKTDGRSVSECGPSLTVPFDDEFMESMSHIAHQSGDVAAIAQEFTRQNARAVEKLLQEADMRPDQVKVVGFHGQTIDHRPDMGITWQIGNPALLAAMTGMDVVADFRSRDMAEGGQGAPLVPLYHAALARALPKPLVVLNIGGIANVTYIDEETHNPWLLAFDTGPGNALMNDMVQRATGAHYDKDGALAAKGKPDTRAIEGYLYDTYFATPPPKSLDRYDFGLEPVLHLSTEDALATLCELTAQTIAKAVDYFPHAPKQWLVAGGGAHNPVLMKRLQDLLGTVKHAADAGWDGDALEAQAFAYLAVRSLQKLPLTLPQLTGVRRAVTGGAFYPA